MACCSGGDSHRLPSLPQRLKPLLVWLVMARLKPCPFEGSVVGELYGWGMGPLLHLLDSPVNRRLIETSSENKRVAVLTRTGHLNVYELRSCKPFTSFTIYL